MRMASYRDTARYLAEAGFYVFPVDGKAPRVRWRDESTRDSAQIDEWGARWPDAGVGIDCGKSGIVVIDLDVKNDIDGVTGWKELTRDAAPATYYAATPSGGWHLYYRDPEGRYRNSASQAAPGVDVRGVGGYVVAPGSPGYTWHAEIPLSVDDLVVMPAGLIEPSTGATHTGHWRELDRDALDPRDLATLDALEGLGGHSAYAVDGYVAVTRPGKTSGASASIGHIGPGVAKIFTPHWPGLAEGGRYTADDLVDLALGSAINDEWEDSFWAARPYLEHVHKAARARGLAPWALLGSSLAHHAATIPPHTYLPPIIGHDGSLNMFVGLCGPSGSGKTASASAAPKATPPSGEYSVWPVGTGEGLAAALVVYNKTKKEYVPRFSHMSVLVEADELDTLTALAQRTGATLMPQLRTAITGGRLGFGNSGEENQRVVEPHTYRLVFLIGIQPLRAKVLLDEADSGTPQRLLWFPTLDPGIPDVPPPDPGAWTSGHAPLRVGTPTKPVYVKVCEKAQTEIRSANIAKHRGETDTLDGHSLLTRLKVAAILGFVEGRYVVTDDDWALAGMVMRKSDDTRGGAQRALAAQRRRASHARALDTAEHNAKVTELDVERVMKVIVKRLRRSLDWVTRKDLVRAAGRDHLIVPQALDELLYLEQIEQQRGSRGGTQYRLREDR